MDELRKLLKEGKLSFQQNFIVAFELFKEMLKNDNREILILLFINLIATFFSMTGNPSLILLSRIMGAVVVIRLWMLYKKVIFKIEERQYVNDGLVIRAVILFCLEVLFIFFMLIIFFHYIFTLPEGREIMLTLDYRRGLFLLRVPIIIIGIIFFIGYIHILYLLPVYLSRRGSFWESVKYNLYLLKGNRIRMLIPVILLFVIQMSMVQLLLKLGILGLFINVFIGTAINVYKIIIVSIIYLNVEYTSEIPEEFSYLTGKEEENSYVMENKIENNNKKLFQIFRF